jgi:hypothetical protein
MTSKAYCSTPLCHSVLTVRTLILVAVLYTCLSLKLLMLVLHFLNYLIFFLKSPNGKEGVTLYLELPYTWTVMVIRT